MSACLAADKVTYDYIWLNKLVPVPAGTSGRNFFPVPVGSCSGRNLKNWFRCTPTVRYGIIIGMVWVWNAIVCYSMVPYDMVRGRYGNNSNMLLYSTALYGMVWYGMVWYVMLWYGICGIA